MKYTFTIELNGRDIVPGGIRIQMNGKGNYMQASKEITSLPFDVGLLVGSLAKKVLFDNEPIEDYNTKIMGDMFADGFKRGLSNQVGTIDRKTAPATVTSFSVKEEE